MKFTLDAYENLLENIKDKGYQFKNYRNWQEAEKTVILRHDVDYSLKKAVEFSEIEKRVQGVSATYFVLLSTDFYNVHSRDSRECIMKIVQNGGNIGLHFDESQYFISDDVELRKCICMEAEIMSDVIGTKVDTVSMHRPASKYLDQNICLGGIINAYDTVYFKKMKYLSDSRRHWRECVDEIIGQSAYDRIHLLTHPFWYMKEEKDLRRTLKEAILNASLEYYDNMDHNFRNLSCEVEKREIERIVSV